MPTKTAIYSIKAHFHAAAYIIYVEEVYYNGKCEQQYYIL